MVQKMRKMKDSGIEWIGEIPEGWEIVPVRSCFDEVRTKNTDGQEQNALQFKSGNIISKANFNANIDDYVADTITNYTVVLPDTVMINGLNLNYDFKSLRVALVKEKGVITPAYLAIFPDRKKIFPQYATYLFKGYETKMAFHNMGAGIRKTLGYKEFKNQPLLLPSKEEQNKISAYLDSKCSHIDIMLSKIRSSIEEYKKLKQAVITQAVTKGVRGEREMRDSGVEWIGKIPKEWVIQKIKSISSRINVGVVIRPSEYFDENGTVPFLRGINVKEYLISSDNMVYINESSNHILSKSQVHTDDILIVRDGSIGTSCVVPAEYDGANVVSMVIVTPSTSCDSRFICYSLNSDVGKTQFTLTKIGSALTHTSVSAVSDIIVAVPSCAEQKEIADYLDAKCAEIDGLIAKKEQLVKELESYKKSLIYEVVTGKREV
ncbi:restriction endonuclease subunit S [uncultured Faecalibacterium sp.]|uniref:restriction endonuclease subunit S n=1 Tax=uncultured Faecalibacterium sp. TaxID=259315 RepID=UPI0026DCC751|nr:restriction endonuclease subunit S [uncultured Faecalibacterium sp.]